MRRLGQAPVIPVSGVRSVNGDGDRGGACVPDGHRPQFVWPSASDCTRLRGPVWLETEAMVGWSTLHSAIGLMSRTCLWRTRRVAVIMRVAPWARGGRRGRDGDSDGGHREVGRLNDARVGGGDVGLAGEERGDQAGGADGRHTDGRELVQIAWGGHVGERAVTVRRLGGRGSRLVLDVTYFLGQSVVCDLRGSLKALSSLPSPRCRCVGSCTSSTDRKSTATFSGIASTMQDPVARMRRDALLRAGHQATALWPTRAVTRS